MLPWKSVFRILLKNKLSFIYDTIQINPDLNLDYYLVQITIYFVTAIWRIFGTYMHVHVHVRAYT